MKNSKFAQCGWKGSNECDPPPGEPAKLELKTPDPMSGVLVDGCVHGVAGVEPNRTEILSTREIE